jgi:23S rRNA (adenine2503-C2)-methyltransferase
VIASPSAPTADRAVSERLNLLDLAPDAALAVLAGFMAESGEAGYRAAQVFARLWSRPVGTFDEMTELPKPLRQRLA